MASEPQSEATETKPMSEGQLDHVVGGLGLGGPGISLDRSKLSLDLGALDPAPLDAARPLTGGSSVATDDPRADLTSIENVLAGNFRSIVALGGSDGTAALNTAVGRAATSFQMAGFDADTAKAMAWTSAYDQMSKGAGSAFDAYPAAKATILSHSDDIAKGIGAAVSLTGDLAGALTKTTDMLASAGSKLSGQALQAVLDKGGSALEYGLDFASRTRQGKAVMGVINDPGNVESWKNLWAQAALSSSMPKLATPINVLCYFVENGAMAKVFGNDAPGEVKQVAGAIRATISGLQDTFLAGYKSGYIGLAGNTATMLFEAGKNIADLGKAMYSGDTGAMKAAALSLVSDLFHDYKNMLKDYYYDTPKVVVEYLGKTLSTTMDKLGATAVATEAAAVTAQAMKDFGDLAKNGTLEAVSVIGDFAKSGVHGAADVAEDLARHGIKGAMDVVSDLAANGKVAMGTIENLVRAGASGAAEALESLAKRGIDGAVTGVEHMVKEGKIALGVLENLASTGAKEAVGAIENLARQGVSGASTAIEGLARQGVAGAIDAAEHLVKGGQMAIDTLENLARSGVSGALSAIDHLARAGSREAVATLGNLAIGGLTAAALPLVELAKLGILPDAVTQAVERILTNAPQMVVDGLVNEAKRYANTVEGAAQIIAAGVAHGSTAAFNAAADLAKTATEAVRGHLVDGLITAANSGGALAAQAAAELGSITLLGGQAAFKAFDELLTMSRKGGAIAEAAVGAIADVANSGAVHAQTAIHTLGEVARWSTAGYERAAHALTTVALGGGQYASYAVDGLKIAAQWGSEAAMDALSKIGREAQSLSSIAKSAVDGLRTAATIGWDYAENTIRSLASSGVHYAYKALKSAENFFRQVGSWIEVKMNPTRW
ncbi:hypothetical protein [Nitrospirillum sp. BR 11163]|uniref:hypothetical protein n=1 Tax=Nitrospirillum sp. BR 11163 TaxID=3104323 RepID=UPI002AFE7A9A|nr:hypothetical protein [Nitrospirillum sp. BR 11163]MEA1672863.1 hypothetical protein [Nitrospirillum sp. BR 11163]